MNLRLCVCVLRASTCANCIYHSMGENVTKLKIDWKWKYQTKQKRIMRLANENHRKVGHWYHHCKRSCKYFFTFFWQYMYMIWLFNVHIFSLLLKRTHSVRFIVQKTTTTTNIGIESMPVCVLCIRTVLFWCAKPETGTITTLKLLYTIFFFVRAIIFNFRSINRPHKNESTTRKTLLRWIINWLAVSESSWVVFIFSVPVPLPFSITTTTHYDVFPFTVVVEFVCGDPFFFLFIYIYIV